MTRCADCSKPRGSREHRKPRGHHVSRVWFDELIDSVTLDETLPPDVVAMVDGRGLVVCWAAKADTKADAKADPVPVLAELDT